MTETAEFTKVELDTPPAYAKPSESGARSSLEVVPVPPSDRKVAYFTSQHLEAPNWSPDGKFLVFNQGGRLYKMPTNGVPELINTGTLIHVNNDHGISPDGTTLAISDGTLPGGSRIYVCRGQNKMRENCRSKRRIIVAAKGFFFQDAPFTIALSCFSLLQSSRFSAG